MQGRHFTAYRLKKYSMKDHVFRGQEVEGNVRSSMLIYCKADYVEPSNAIIDGGGPAYEREKSSLVWLKIVSLSEDKRSSRYSFLQEGNKKEEPPECFKYLKCFQDLRGEHFIEMFGGSCEKLKQVSNQSASV